MSICTKMTNVFTDWPFVSIQYFTQFVLWFIHEGLINITIDYQRRRVIVCFSNKFHIHVHNTQIKLEYQGHSVKVKWEKNIIFHTIFNLFTFLSFSIYLNCFWDPCATRMMCLRLGGSLAQWLLQYFNFLNSLDLLLQTESAIESDSSIWSSCRLITGRNEVGPR